MIKKISVIIPVKNEATKIRACISSILNQSIAVDKIIIIDSGSTDGTIEILGEFSQVHVINIPSESFNHGTTRNLGSSHSYSDYFLLTVGDAYPSDPDWIKKMLDVFEDPSVMAVCGKQVVPHEPDKNPVEWYRPVSKGEIVKYKFTKEEFEKLTPSEKLKACSWDDVTAMYRRSALIETPFQKTTYAEDAIWAKDALMKGYTIAYNPEAMVYHYHLENSDFTFKRTLTTFYFRYRHFGYIYSKPVKSIIDWLRIMNTIRKSNPLTVKQKIKWFFYNIQQHKASVRAYHVFNEALVKGEEELDKVHQHYCGKPPIPSKPKVI